MALPTPLESESRERRHELFAWTICLEATICFAVPGLLVLVGTLFLPVVIFSLLVDPGRWQLPYLGGVAIAGSAMSSVIRVVFMLCTRHERDERAWLTLLGICAGIACTLYPLWSVTRAPEEDIGMGNSAWSFAPIFLTYLPLACTAHLIYLARRPLFGRSEGASLAEGAG